jgi:hypothetical protein
MGDNNWGHFCQSKTVPYFRVKFKQHFSPASDCFTRVRQMKNKMAERVDGRAFQGMEHLTVNQRVSGSSPEGGAELNP